MDTKKWYYTVYCTGVLAYTDGKKSVKIEIAKNVFFTGWSESHLYHIIEISTIYDFHCIPITNIFWKFNFHWFFLTVYLGQFVTRGPAYSHPKNSIPQLIPVIHLPFTMLTPRVQITEVKYYSGRKKGEFTDKNSPYRQKN